MLCIHTRILTPHRYQPVSHTHPTATMHPKDSCLSSTQQTPHAPSTHSTGSPQAANPARRPPHPHPPVLCSVEFSPLSSSGCRKEQSRTLHYPVALQARF